MLTVAASLVATLFGLLVALLGWLGSKIYNKLDEMNLTMHTIASDLHEKINDLDRRVTKVETRCESNH
jgi:cell division protein FtsB